MTRFLLPLLPLLAVAAPALAQSRAAGQTRLDAEFARTDRNRDGFVSRDEFAQRLAHLRIAGRGVTPQETQTLADHWFTRADRNRDGRVGRDEASALYALVFARADANHDGRISPAEREAAKAELLTQGVR